VSCTRKLLRYFIPIFFLLTSLSSQGQADAGQLKLAWTDNSNNEDGFKIERKTGTSGTYGEIAKLGANVASYTDTNLTDGATYCYRLRAFNSAGNSAYSPEGCATVKSTLLITKIGSGTVTSSPAGINCGSDCNESYPNGTVVTLSGAAAAGFVFAGWSGSGCGTGLVTMNGSKTCAATFNTGFTLNVNVVRAMTTAGTGNGTVTSNPAGINCGGDCSESYASGTVVALSAIPAPGSVFSGWSGNGCSTGSVTMNNNRNCTATFNAVAVQTFGLSVNKTGTGNGTVTSNPAGINCGSDCSESYTSGTVVALSAISAPGSVFSRWTGNVPLGPLP
jgi:Divergent InlB B-repeat domain